MTAYAATLESIQEAQNRIAPYAHRTPVLTCSTLDKLAGRELFFKCENLQKVGAFKFRGACNAILRLPAEIASQGVATHSSGNHAQAVALAASIRGIDAHIVMPTNAPHVKRRAVEGYGARIYPCEPTLAAREALAAEVIEKTGATLIPPYDHPDVIAGQGTVGLELMEQVPSLQGSSWARGGSLPDTDSDAQQRSTAATGVPARRDDERTELALDAIVAPVGGGGLISGVSIAARGLDPVIRLFAAEPIGADDAARSLAAGRLIKQTNPNTIADGLLTSLGQHTWPIIRDHVERIITVADDQIIEAMRLVWERMKIIIEPSSAVAVAAVLSDEFKSLSGIARVGVILSGGNVDVRRLIG